MTTPTSTYIHLGLPKTATTCFQSHLFANHSQIHYFGKFEPEGFPATVHPVLLSNFHGVMKFAPGDIRGESIQKQLAYATENTLTPVLSKEGFSGGAALKKAEQAKLLRKNFGDCKAILFVREPVSFIKSYYVQSLKGFQKRGKTRRSDWMRSLGKPPRYFDINEWMHVIWYSRTSPEQLLSYADTAEIYADVFGRENVKIFIFEEFVKNPKVLVTQLCDYMGIDADEGFRLIDGKRANDRMTTGYIDRLKAIESSRIQSFKFRMAKPGERLKMLDPTDISGEKIDPELSDEWLAKIHAVGDEQNRRIVKTWGLPLTDFGYRV